MRQRRGKRLVLGLGVLVATVWACETARNPGGVQRDLIPPTISLTPASDTEQIANGLALTVTAGDNLGLQDIRLIFSGGFFDTTDTVFNTTVTSVTLPVDIKFPATSGAGGPITIIGRATDGSGNFTEDTIVIVLTNVKALKVLLLAPATGAIASTGKNIPVLVRAVQAGGIQKIGFLIAPRSAVVDSTPLPVNSTDSIIYVVPFADSIDYTDTLSVLATSGTFTVTGFAVDADGVRGVSNSVVVTVQSAANDVTPPTVSFTIGSRVEVNDTITVHATDPSGISWIGFRVDTSLTGPPLRFDTVDVSAGKLTDVVKAFALGLASVITKFPTSVIVRGYACDLAVARNCGYSSSSTVITGAAPVFRASAAGGGLDTVIVVAGITYGLPLGGQIADAIFNTNRRELYLTNTTLGRVDIFQLATNTFDPNGIATAGPVPFGIALWPDDTLGHYSRDTIVVADAGGTELSILDASTRLLLWRQGLPNFLIEEYHLLTTSLGVQANIVVHDVSDRPQYLGTLCRVTSGGSACAPDSIYALYSTTPTQSSSSPFNGRATLRMEKLINTTDTTQLFGHLFWEIGALGRNVVGDTLRVELDRPALNQRQVVLTACALVTIDFPSFGLGDQTFVRNSGNFAHGFVGEGGNISTEFARVFGYSAKLPLIAGAGTDTSCLMGGVIPEAGQRDRDFGMSPGVQVSDFISNTGIHVVSVATNFNGLTNLVRADSVYYLDQGLRLWGTSAVGSTTPGMDMNYNHNFQPGGACTPTCGGTGSTANRMAFAASPDTSILVFDTYFFNQQARIPIRDPIIGPLRVALDTTGTGQQYLFAITARGLVVVTLPAIPNTNPQAPPPPPGWPISASSVAPAATRPAVAPRARAPARAPARTPRP